MPPVSAVVVGPNALTVLSITDASGTVSLLASAIPVAQNTIALVETWINTTWIPANVDSTKYQVLVHVVRISPVVVNAIVGDVGLAIPATWWAA